MNARLYSVETLKSAYMRVQDWDRFGYAIDATLHPHTSVRTLEVIADAIRLLQNVEPQITPSPDGVRVTAPAAEIVAVQTIGREP